MFHREVIGDPALVGSYNHDYQNDETRGHVLQGRFQTQRQKPGRHHGHNEIADQDTDHKVAVTEESQSNVKTQHAVEEDVCAGKVLLCGDLSGDGNVNEGSHPDEHAGHYKHQECVFLGLNADILRNLLTVCDGPDIIAELRMGEDEIECGKHNGKNDEAGWNIAENRVLFRERRTPADVK